MASTTSGKNEPQKTTQTTRTDPAPMNVRGDVQDADRDVGETGNARTDVTPGADLVSDVERHRSTYQRLVQGGVPAGELEADEKAASDKK